MIFDFLKLYFQYPGKQGAFFRKQYDCLWPLLRRCAQFYRKHFLKSTCVVAVIGSLGKTTTKRALQLLFNEGPLKQSFSNYGSCLAENLLRVHSSDAFAVLEVGIDHPGEMKPQAEMVAPDVAVVTTIKSEHNRSFESLEETREEKAHMVRRLGSKGLAILNGDDPHTIWMATQTEAKVKTFGFNAENDVRASDVILDWPQGQTFQLHVGNERRTVKTKLLGRHMIYSLLAAIALGSEEGMKLEEMIAKLESLTPTPGRMEIIALENGALMIDDTFKAALETMEEGLKTLKEIPAQHKIIIAGDIQEPPSKQGPLYKALGRRMAQCANTIVYSGNHFDRIKTGVKESNIQGIQLINFKSNPLQHIKDIQASLKTGDVLYLKGRNTDRFRRFSLLLQGRAVKCPVKYCSIKFSLCDDCPLLNAEAKDFDNSIIASLVK